MDSSLRVVVIKPSKYAVDGSVERFRWGFMPNSTVPHMRSMTPSQVGSTRIDVHAVDEYVFTDLNYLSLLKRQRGGRTLVALVGVQSHQFHRALDLAAYARKNGCMSIIGGPHVMTCDTSLFHDSGVSFALPEAELAWPQILEDAARGELRPVYGREQRWQEELQAPVIVPPNRTELGRYIHPMLGLYPARGCPFICNFCSVIKIAGRRIRTQSIDTTMASLRAAKSAGVKLIMFTSDNFNKYPDAEALLEAMAEERLDMKFFVQCDTQMARQERLVELLAKAGCFQVFVGAESFDRKTLLAAKKGQNRPETYRDIVRLCREYRVGSHFSNMIGFPQQTEQEIDEHLDTLCELEPTIASFYVLCPIPGTEQYDDFMSDGLITEKNLDRFDTSCLTWRHPHLSPERMSQLLFDCYRKFNSFPRLLSRVKLMKASIGNIAISLFNRYCAWQRVHPMSGGVLSVRRDHMRDYISLRREAYGFELAPLPQSITVQPEESLKRRSAKPDIRLATAAG